MDNVPKPSIWPQWALQRVWWHISQTSFHAKMARTSGYSIRLGDDGDDEDDDNSDSNNNSNNNNLQTAPNCRTLAETISRFARGEIVSLLAEFSHPLPPQPPNPHPPLTLTSLLLYHECLVFCNRTVCGPEVQYRPMNLPRHSHKPIKVCFRVIVL